MSRNRSNLLEDEAEDPEEAEDDVLGHGQVVVVGAEGFFIMIMLCDDQY